MKNNWNKILLELSYRVSTGIPDLSNEQHLMKLWDILKEHNWNLDARVELLKNLNELEFRTPEQFAAYKAKHKMRPGTVVKVAGKDKVIDEPEEKPTDDKGKEPETKEIRAIRTAIEKNKFDFDIEDTDEQIQDIAKKTTKSEYIVTDSKKASERTKEIKRKVIEEGLSGKGGS